MKIKLVVGLAVVAALGAGILFHVTSGPWTSSHGPAVRVSTTQSNSTGLAPARTPVGASEAALVRHELAQVQAQVAELKGALADKQAAEQAQDPYDQLTDAERRAYHDEKWSEHMAEVAAAFEQEPRDAGWATAANDALRAELANRPALLAAARDIDCRSSTCRVTLPRDDDGQVDKQLPLLLNRLSNTLPEMEAKETTVNGRSTYTLYLKDSRRRLAQAAPARAQ